MKDQAGWIENCDWIDNVPGGGTPVVPDKFYETDFSAKASGLDITAIPPDISTAGNSHQQYAALQELQTSATYGRLASPNTSAAHGWIDIEETDWIGETDCVAVNTGQIQITKMDPASSGAASLDGVVCQMAPQVGEQRIQSYVSNVPTTQDSVAFSGNYVGKFWASFLGNECRVYDQTQTEILSYLTMTSSEQAYTALKLGTRRLADGYISIACWNKTDFTDIPL